MNSKKFFLLMVCLLVILGIGIVSAVYISNKMLVRESNKLINLKLDSQVADQQQTSLAQAKKDITKYTDLTKAAKFIVPQDKDQAESVREIVNIASKSGVSLGSINFPSSTLGQKAASSSASTTAPTSETAKNIALTQVQPVSGLKGVYVMPITIQSDNATTVAYTSFIKFLQNLENNRRTAQVSSINITPDKQNNSNLSFTLVLNVYIKP